MGYQKSVFFAPVWFGDYEAFCNSVARTGGWDEIDLQEFSPRYLLTYAARIAKDKRYFSSYRLNEFSKYKIDIEEGAFGLSKIPAIVDVRLSCFVTGGGFVEFRISYSDESPEAITDFSYWFKKSKSQSIKSPSGELQTLYKAIYEMLPKDYKFELFFTNVASFKQECVGYHFMCLDNSIDNSERLSNCLFWLKRSYKTTFSREEIDEKFDMIYKPYNYDCWSGSCEGLVNIAYLTGDDEKDVYMKMYKESQMEIDNYFSYLLLLNQRYSAIKYIDLISNYSDCSIADLENLNRKVVQLKTVLSFSVISDDRIVQSVYSKMFAIMEIDRLLADIQDNEAQMEMLQNARLERSEKRLGKILSVLSLLTVFSSMIDAATYFDRISWLEPISTILSLVITVVLVSLGLFWLLSKRNK